MKIDEIKISSVKFDGANVNFTLESTGFIGYFRIYYSDDSRKNAQYKSLNAISAYFEGIPAAPASVCVDHVTDAMLFVERKMQWILEKVQRDVEQEQYS